jgi:hypothetical protein
MDDKGYAFTPLALLLIIPVVIIAVSYGNIANEINKISTVAIGGDVVKTTGESIVSGIKVSSADAGRNSAYRATKQVLDNEADKNVNPYLSNSTDYIEDLLVISLNNNIVETAKKLENETGRDVYINNMNITNSTPSTASTITKNDIIIYQTDPYGFYINVTGGMNITVIQNGQNYTFKTPTVSSYVSIEGLEDPYIWTKTKNRESYLIYKYPFYNRYGLAGEYIDYHMDDSWNGTGLYHLKECLNGTNNSGGITPNPYYFPDPRGLTFFDRLEGKTNNTSKGPNSAKISTFIIGTPLSNDYNGADISSLDHEYFTGVAGTPITISGVKILDPRGKIFILSTGYKGYLDLSSSY